VGGWVKYDLINSYNLGIEKATDFLRQLALYSKGIINLAPDFKPCRGKTAI